jgi:hypothetical protein
LWRDVCLNTCVCWSYTLQTQKATTKKLQTRNTLKLKHFETKWNLQKQTYLKLELKLEKPFSSPAPTQIFKKRVVPIWRARQNKERTKDQQIATLRIATLRSVEQQKQ